MKEKHKKHNSFAMPFLAMTAILSFIILIGALGYGIASANNNPEEAKQLGLYKTTSADSSVGQLEDAVMASRGTTYPAQDFDASAKSANNAGESSEAGDDGGNESENANKRSDVNSTSSGFNITAAASQIDAKHEQERIAAEEAKKEEQRKKDEDAQKRAEEMKKKSDASEALTGLEEVDWSVGESAFLEEWTSRIDNYLKGTALSGYGATFARAAWNNGVDPRWSPAISNTESGNGANCFHPHNAWGWGESSWSSWEEAINAHVAGLAKGYGYSITYACAEKYCPPNTEFWFNNTLSQMKKI